MKRLLAPVAPLALIVALALTGCGSSPAPEPTAADRTEVEVSVPETEQTEDSFVDGVLVQNGAKIVITDSRVIPVGEAGNEYGDVPVLAFWYDVTNLGTTDRDITPSEFIFAFNAFQDNDPNRENELDVAMHPDGELVDAQMDKIKPEGTVSGAVGYELDDTTTPVELVAGSPFGDELGRMTFKLN